MGDGATDPVELPRLAIRVNIGLGRGILEQYAPKLVPQAMPFDGRSILVVLFLIGVLRDVYLCQYRREGFDDVRQFWPFGSSASAITSSSSFCQWALCQE